MTRPGGKPSGRPDGRAIERMAPSVDTPCNGECIIDPETGYCQGCWRTMTEIRKWLTYTDEQRKRIYQVIEARKQGLTGPADD